RGDPSLARIIRRLGPIRRQAVARADEPKLEGQLTAVKGLQMQRNLGGILVLEQIQVGRSPELRLLACQALRGPSIETIPRRRERALLDVRTRIELQVPVSQVRKDVAYHGLVVRRALRQRRYKDSAQGAHLAPIE